MSRITSDQLQWNIKSNHSELIKKMKLLGLTEIKTVNGIVPWQIQNEQPNFIQLTKIFEEGTFDSYSSKQV